MAFDTCISPFSTVCVEIMALGSYRSVLTMALISIVLEFAYLHETHGNQLEPIPINESRPQNRPSYTEKISKLEGLPPTLSVFEGPIPTVTSLYLSETYTDSRQSKLIFMTKSNLHGGKSSVSIDRGTVVENLHLSPSFSEPEFPFTSRNILRSKTPFTTDKSVTQSIKWDHISEAPFTMMLTNQLHDSVISVFSKPPITYFKFSPRPFSPSQSSKFLSLHANNRNSHFSSYVSSSSILSQSFTLDKTQTLDAEKIYIDLNSDTLKTGLFSKTCKSDCLIDPDNSILCFASLPCEVPESIHNIDFFVPDFQYLVKEYHAKFNRYSILFNSITTITLRFLDLRINDEEEMSAFLGMFHSVRRVNIRGWPWIRCSRAHLDVLHFSVQWCRFLFNANSLKSSVISCFPNLVEITFRNSQYGFTCGDPSQKNDSFPSSFNLDLNTIRKSLPKLKFLTLQFDDIFLYGATFRDTYRNMCQISVLERIIINWSKLYQLKIGCQCKCNHILFTDFQRKENYDVNPLQFDFYGYQHVKILFTLDDCPSKLTGPYAKILYSFESKLYIKRNCTQFEISVNWYNKIVSYLIWYLYQVQRSVRHVERTINLTLANRKLCYILFYEGFGDKIILSRSVNFSHNHLGKMAESHRVDFGKILYSFKDLETIDFAENGITELPQEIFFKSMNLKTIILSQNRLTKLGMQQFMHLQKLKLLDISHNKIKITEYGKLYGEFVSHFLLFMNGSFTNNAGTAFECNFQSFVNPKLIEEASINIDTIISTPLCVLGNEEYVKFSELASHCKRENMLNILKYCLASVGMSVVTTFISFVVKRKCKRRILVDRFIDDVKHGRDRKEFLLFLSYSSKDGNMVHKLILPEIQKRLLAKAGIEKDDKEFICTGDCHFIPGFNIIQEAMRCISSCSVVIFVVSKSFVLSPFCRMEVKEALDQAKPIILMMTGKIGQRRMPRIIKSIFNKYSRFHFNRGDNGVRVSPGWDVLVSAIYELAANEQNDFKKLEYIKEEHYKKIERVNEIEMKEILKE